MQPINVFPTYRRILIELHNAIVTSKRYKVSANEAQDIIDQFQRLMNGEA